MLPGKSSDATPVPTAIGFFSTCRYPLAVTEYQDDEKCSSSIYTQNNPWNPPVVFEDFIQNDTNIEDKVIPIPTAHLRPVTNHCLDRSLVPAVVITRC